MRSICLCLCLLSLILATDPAGAIDQEFPPYESVDIISSSFGQSFVESLFGAGVASTDLSEQWFGPTFQNTTSAYSFLSEFYINTSMPMAGGLAPARIDVSQRLPAKIYFGSGQEILYTQYQTAISASRSNELWIVKYQDWSQYAIVPLGIGLQFIAFAPTGGQADYYEILQTDNQNLTARKVDLYAGHTSLSFPADSVGRHIIFYVLNNQPSNAIIIDVISPPQASPAVQMPQTSDMPPAFGQMGAISGGAIQTTATSIGQTTTTAIAGPSAVASQPAQVAPSGDTPVTISSLGMRNYQIYLDGALIGTEGTGGDAPDGQFSFNVVGDREHDIRVYDGQFNYPKRMFFQRGVLKIINVEPGTAVYI